MIRVLSLKAYQFCFVAATLSLSNFAAGAPLDATGASWLFPLTGDTEKNGFCNSVSLSSGKVISNEQFKAIAKRVNADANEQFCAGTTEPILRIMNEGDRNFMRSCNHLAQLNGLRDEVDRANAWQLVGFRFDPCVNALGRHIKGLDDLAGCSSEARLVAQPVVLRPDGSRDVLDSSLHLIYAVNGAAEVAEIVRDLKAVQEISKKVAGSSYPPPTLFSAHPGLEAERRRGQCNGTSAQAIHNFLAKHTTPSRLTQVAFMTSSGALKQWTFGVSQPQAGFQFGSTPIGKFDNFSDSLLAQSQFPVNAEMKGANSIINVSRAFELVSQPTTTPFDTNQKESARKQLDLLNDIMNPRVTSQLNVSGGSRWFEEHKKRERSLQ